ncbi:MAG: glucose-6-phosphate isomerase [Verrucomicrobiales bacterium]|jgi:glucose-6-phosphate isomerase
MDDSQTNSSATPDWQAFCTHYLRYPELGVSIDYSRIQFSPGFFDKMAPLCATAFKEMAEVESGAIANADEQRMVGHYWLRNAALAPSSELRETIESGIEDATQFAKAVHAGEISAANGKAFRNVLCIGIGGSALGPQLLKHALVDHDAPLQTWFFDNTDPDGMARVLDEIGSELSETLTVVTSKSGGTAETRNGMLQTAAAYEAQGLDFARHAVAITGNGSKLDTEAQSKGWLKRFPMEDWIGGRTSLMSTVGLVPAALQGIDIAALLEGAAEMDAHTRSTDVQSNLSMLLALAWYSTGDGAGKKDMVILPYKDRLELFGKYLQQLIMESIGKERDRDGNIVNQGIAVYGNKGSTDQHAYVQQLRDGINNFFATFIEVHRSGNDARADLEVEPDTTSGDYLQGFLRGTRSALWEGGRESVTLSISTVDAKRLGALIAAFERTVSFYASLVNVNAYHQPGVEAGKKAAGQFLSSMKEVKAALQQQTSAVTAGELADSVAADAETVFHILTHLAANELSIESNQGSSPMEDQFRVR